MSARWSAVDSPATDLLTELAGVEHTEQTDAEWAHFTTTLRAVAAEYGGLILQNAVREELRGQVHPRRIGAFYRRALLEQLIEPTGTHEVSDDLHSRNRGRPTRVYRYQEPTP